MAQVKRSYASFWVRALAFALEYLVIVVYLILMTILGLAVNAAFPVLEFPKHLTKRKYVYILVFMNKQLPQSIQAQCAIVYASCANAHLRQATRAVTQLYARILAPSGLEPTQFTLLVACALAGQAPITTLAEALVMDRTTLARNLKPLERRGLVKVVSGEDHRVRMVTLSEEGNSTLSRALPLWQEAQTQIAEGFGQNRLDNLLQDLSAMADLAHDN